MNTNTRLIQESEILESYAEMLFDGADLHDVYHNMIRAVEAMQLAAKEL